MSGRIVIITGAKGGLGSFVTQRFLNGGDTVIGASRSIRQSDFDHAKFIAVPTDFSDPASVTNLAEKAFKQFERIDVLVHVMGGFAGGKPVHQIDDATWLQMQESNLTSAFNISRAVIPLMRQALRGRIIAVGSKAAEQPHSNLAAYVVSKAALVTLIK